MNGSSGVAEEPSIPAPIRSNTVDIQLPASLTTKMKLSDFSFLKVRDKKNSLKFFLVVWFMKIPSVVECTMCPQENTEMFYRDFLSPMALLGFLH